ncbi:DUF4349 domain-containing protein [Sphingomonas sp. M1-B02]|uniref:DUF4349 domain-containing protein n=1 Tax=Sphingomonas sp. M1-B02 TaxID=3114300 RepID=UPI00223EFB8A|nr:DUF4349 domain-containing protein [Sphingomonas sp. S6-11]UZK66718.1 DUF4349 domain-containing protein [Sphingomonas sp. S6-11]
MRRILALATAATLAACSAENPDTTQPGQSVAEGVPNDALAADIARSAVPADPRSKLPTTLPQLSYAYTLSYLVPGDKIATAQDAHRELCAEMGPSRCQLVGLERGVGSDRSNAASLKLRVATSEAHRFQVLLDHSVNAAGGRAENATIATDEVSKQIVDTEARVRQRELLVARHTEMLRKRGGTPADLLDAERSIAQAQGELEQGRSWLAELRGRVAMSDFQIRYAAIAPSAGQIGAQLGESLSGSAAVFLIGLRFLLSLLIYLLPWGLLAAIPVVAFRALRRRRASEA